MELDPAKIVVIGLVASALSAALRLLAEKLEWEMSGAVANVVMALISLGLALAWNPPVSAPEDIFVYVGSIVGWAGLIFKVLTEKVVFPKIRQFVSFVSE